MPQLDDYDYDELNRIKFVTEAQLNSSGGWTFNLFTQNFNYDRWGNRTVSCSPCQPGVTGDVFTIDTATNRITAKNGTGMTYDAAGNQTYDATGNRWFDGENRMHKATQGGTTSHYVYDADGKRVRRIIGSTETWIIYGVDGELVGEYAAAASSSNPQKEYGYRSGQMLIAAETSPLKITWLVTDHLGTPRMNVRGTGTDGGSLASVTRHDYLPFGEDLIAGIRVNGGSGQHGYEPPPDGVRQKFTRYERDGETGLDYAQARYYAGMQGRFTSIDPTLSSAQPEAPQSWNRYIFALNSPLIYIDPDGKAVIVVIWATADGRVGHAGIAVSNYKEVKRRVKENGKWKTKTEKVADGTYTYRDLWPGGDGVGKKNVDRDVPASYGDKIVTLNELLNTDVTGSEHYNPDGAIKLETDYATDQAVLQSLDAFQKANPKYNGLKCNCSDLVEHGLETASGNQLPVDEFITTRSMTTFGSFGKATIGSKTVPVYATTPNQLFKAARGLSNATVIKDPGDKVNRSFLQGVKGR